ncbi:hypothetical protein [Novipirellula rosea]|uniref:RiboL-PSP-HEPN domain-containing protein n=1 Tax=Novipirellula rosea TaxID=1031540 RepID=A0ABP8MVY6_9BACT
MLKSHDYYRDKCLEHLDRVMISHACAFAAPSDVLASTLENPDEEKRKQLVNDIHFVALKTNFELFLMRSLRQVWLEYLSQIPRKRPLEVMMGKVGALVTEEDIEEFVDGLVPQHGLQRLGRALEDVTDIKLPSVAGRLWPQIAITFGVRHLIEHGNGRVDEKFANEQTRNWSGSSFARSPVPGSGEKVVLQESDVQASYQSMIETVPLISSRLNDWSK